MPTANRIASVTAKPVAIFFSILSRIFVFEGENKAGVRIQEPGARRKEYLLKRVAAFSFWILTPDSWLLLLIMSQRLDRINLRRARRRIECGDDGDEHRKQ